MDSDIRNKTRTDAAAELGAHGPSQVVFRPNFEIGSSLSNA